MSIPNIIAYLSIFVWLFPPLKQRGTKYFLFFTLLAVSDPLAFLFYYFFHINVLRFYSVMVLMTIYSLANHNLKSKFITFAFIIIDLLIGKNLDIQKLWVENSIIQTVVLIMIIKDFLVFMENKSALNIFLILLISYQIITIYKMMALVSPLKDNFVINSLSSFIQLFYGIIFIAVNVDTKSPPFDIADFNKK